MLLKTTAVFICLTIFLACTKEIPVALSNGESLTVIEYSPKAYDIYRGKRSMYRDTMSFPEMAIPADNPMTVEGVTLGRLLFYDPILSADSTQSCSSCHAPNLAFTDAKAVSAGISGQTGKRSAMSLENIGFQNRQLFWDGRVATLEEQALLPVEDPIELHNTWGNLEKKLQKHPKYPAAFRRAFGISNSEEITKSLVTKALAQFERSIISSGESKYDRVARRLTYFTDEELNGYQVFFNLPGAPDAQCGHCHNSPFMTANTFFNNGLDSAATLNDFLDKGRGAVTNIRQDNGKFRAPSLRNIELTAPYMHDGRFTTLDQVVEHYASGGHYSDNLDPFLPQIREMRMTARQKAALIAFLKTLTDRVSVNDAAYKNPF